MALAPLDRFLPAMPADGARADFAAGAVGHGVFAAWCTARTVGERVRATHDLVRSWAGRSPALALVSRGGGPSIGWAVGIAMFDEPIGPLRGFSEEQPITVAIATGLVLAFAAGMRTGLVAQAPYWRVIAEKVGGARPPELAAAIAIGKQSTLVSVRRLAEQLDGEMRRERSADDEVAAAPLPAGATTSADDAAGGATDEVLLDELLEAWRATGDGDLEAPIDQIGAAVARARGPAPPARDQPELVARRDPGDVGRLLEQAWPAPGDQQEQRIRRLATYEPDPRIAAALAEHAASLPARSALHATVADQLARAAADSTLARIDAIERRHPELAAYLGARTAIEAAIAARTHRRAPAALAARARLRCADDASLAAMWAAHAADPGDLAHRAVLGDALQRAHDPRGELIALQLALGETPGLAGAQARVDALIAAYGRRWLPLDATVKEPTFANGFLTALRVSGFARDIEASAASSEWLTVEDLTLDSASLGPLVPRLPLLRRLSVWDEAELARLAEPRAARPPRLRAVACWTEWDLRAIEIPGIVAVGGRWVTTSIAAPTFRALQHLAGERGYAAIAHLQFPAAALAVAAPIARGVGPAETRFAMGLYRGWRSEGWTAIVRRGATDVLLAWDGGPAGAWNLAPNIVGALVQGGTTRVEIAIGPGHGVPLAQLSGLERSLAARHPELAIAHASLAAPFDLGAPA